MKRDMETIRQILLVVEQADQPVDDVPDCAPDAFAYHAALLIEAELAKGDVVEGPDLQPMAVSIFRLTWKGHEFLDSARNDTVWHTAKEKMLKPGVSWTFSLLSEVLKALAKQQLAHAGLPFFESPEA